MTGLLVARSELLRFAVALALLSALHGARGDEAPQPPPWPRTWTQDGLTFQLYRPEVQRWEGERLVERAAVVVQDGGAPAYGAARVEARAVVDGTAVHVSDVRVTGAQFPGAPGQAKRWRASIEAHLPAAYDAPAGALQDDLAIAEAQRTGARTKTGARPVVPRIVYRTSPALLVVVDGAPQLRQVPGTALDRVVNTRPLLVRDHGGAYHLHLLDGWLSSPALDGTWSVERAPSEELARARGWAATHPEIDLLEARAAAPEGGTGSADVVAPPSLAQGAPEVIVSSEPAELVATEGAPQLSHIEGTSLSWVRNTTNDLLADETSGTMYALLAGRWFTAREAAGPWSPADPKALPPDLARIPPGHPKETVLASVPGTPQAKEALLADAVPHTAAVRRDEVHFTVEYDGAPQLAPVDGTYLEYVRNARSPVLRAEDGSFWAVKDGVWFTASDPYGPWTVADRVPPSLYAIPPSSPMHEVTYVRVYGATPDVVYVGYTPGYVGTWVSGGTVVYGTGYAYPCWVGAWWYGRPATWGYGWRVRWSSLYGWDVGVAYAWRPPGYWWGFGVGPYWGPAVIYRPVFVPVRPAWYGGYHGALPAPPPPAAAAGVYHAAWSGQAVAPAPHPAALAAGVAPRPGAPGAAAPAHPAGLAAARPANGAREDRATRPARAPKPPRPHGGEHWHHHR